MPVKKVLLVQLFSNGDCLYASAVARQIKQDFPDCFLTWAIAPFCKDIIANNPYIDEVMLIHSVSKNDVKAFKKLKRTLSEKKQTGEFDEIFITQIMDENQAYYDGCIRSGIFRGYPHTIKVPVTPVLRLTTAEIEKVKLFVEEQQLKKYDHIVLFEFAPQSGQLKITGEMAVSIAESLVKKGNTAVILSSGTALPDLREAVIDGSYLSIRETAALTHYCTLLLGCSSGISWISTSDAARLLPMVQLVNAQTRWINPVSRDFKRFHLPAENIIDLVNFDEQQVTDCVAAALLDFNDARVKYNQPIPLRFNTTRGIIYNLLCYREFKAIKTHIQINRDLYGNNFSFYAEVLKGFLVFPFRLVRNTVVKRLKPFLAGPPRA